MEATEGSVFQLQTVSAFHEARDSCRHYWAPNFAHNVQLSFRNLCLRGTRTKAVSDVSGCKQQYSPPSPQCCAKSRSLALKLRYDRRTADKGFSFNVTSWLTVVAVKHRRYFLSVRGFNLLRETLKACRNLALQDPFWYRHLLPSVRACSIGRRFSFRRSHGLA